MGEMRRAMKALLIVALLVITAGQARAEDAAMDDSRYKSVTIRGRLTEPHTGEPMVGAMVRFVSTEEGGGSAEGKTNAKGEFIVENLGFTTYAVEIETASGEHIRGINELPIEEGKSVEVIMKISDRVVSTTSLENEPGRFVALVRKEGVNWRRFWSELGIFLGGAVALGAAGG